MNIWRKPGTAAVICAATVLWMAGNSTGFAQEAANSGSLSRAQQWADDTGRVAGAATYCQLADDEVENYINRAHAKFASQATDDVDLVIARIHFSNVFNRASSIEPTEGCDSFASFFEQEVDRLN